MKMKAHSSRTYVIWQTQQRKIYSCIVDINKTERSQNQPNDAHNFIVKPEKAKAQISKRTEIIKIGSEINKE
jgi:hypothetical protein